MTLKLSVQAENTKQALKSIETCSSATVTALAQLLALGAVAPQSKEPSTRTGRTKVARVAQGKNTAQKKPRSTVPDTQPPDERPHNALSP